MRCNWYYVLARGVANIGVVLFVGMEEDLQVDYYIRVYVSLYPVVAVADYFLPHLALAHFGDEGAPFLRPEGVFALVWIQLDDRIQDGEVQAPNFDPCRARGLRYRCRLGGDAGLLFWWWRDKR